MIKNSNDLESILAYWKSILLPISEMPFLDAETRDMLMRQMREVNEYLARKEEDNAFGAWRRICSSISESKPVSVVDVNIISVYMQEQERLKDGAKSVQEGEVLPGPAVPRRHTVKDRG